MKKIMIFILVFLLVFGIEVQAVEEPGQLYAQSAVLMDAKDGRVLFEKNGYDIKAMASTTKIMTCVLALEFGNENDIVTFSENAQKQPKVHLGAKNGEQFYLKDMLYSLMLESHNDVAVAIAECVSGTVEDFASLMNRKAKEIGCEDTYFITPNGLDAEDESGMHSTTAADLAMIMSYCIMRSSQKDRFLQISSTMQYSFENLEGTKTYSCNNHNTFLNMMEEAISGKTGFTSQAGYCYVGAIESEGRIFVVALLGCGWPNNKNYKWADMKTLAEYGMENFEMRTINCNPPLSKVRVRDGICQTGNIFEQASVDVEIKKDKELTLLMRKGETTVLKVEQEYVVSAPIKKGTKVGYVKIMLNDKEMARYDIMCKETVEKKSFKWIFCGITKYYAL